MLSSESYSLFYSQKIHIASLWYAAKMRDPQWSESEVLKMTVHLRTQNFRFSVSQRSWKVMVKLVCDFKIVC